MNNNFGTSGFGEYSSVYTPAKFPKYKQVYHASSSADVNYSASFYYSRGWTVTVTSGNPYTMEAELNCEVGSDGVTPISGTGSYITVNWGMRYDNTQQEIIHCTPDLIPWINQINDADKQTFDNYVANPVPLPASSWSLDSTSATAVNAVWNMYMAGQKSIPIVRPSIKKTLVVPSGYDLTSFNSYIYGVYTKSTLATAIGIPTNWQNAMRQDTDLSTTYTRGITYHYGWCKQPPDMAQNGTTITINQEYVYGLYPGNLVNVYTYMG